MLLYLMVVLGSPMVIVVPAAVLMSTPSSVSELMVVTFAGPMFWSEQAEIGQIRAGTRRCRHRPMPQTDT